MSDRVVVPHQEMPPLEIVIEDLQTLAAAFLPGRDILLALASPLRHDRNKKASGRDERLEACLLEKHPLQNSGPIIRVGRDEVGTLGEVPEHGVRLAQTTSVSQDQIGDSPVRVDC